MSFVFWILAQRKFILNIRIKKELWIISKFFFNFCFRGSDVEKGGSDLDLGVPDVDFRGSDVEKGGSELWNNLP